MSTFTKTTLEIKAAMQLAIQGYENDCKTFWGKPGKNGVARKVRLQKLLATIADDSSPVTALNQIYKFYQQEQHGYALSQRLVMRVQRNLAKLLTIGNPVYSRAAIEAQAFSNLQSDRINKRVAEINLEAQPRLFLHSRFKTI